MPPISALAGLPSLPTGGTPPMGDPGVPSGSTVTAVTPTANPQVGSDQLTNLLPWSVPSPSGDRSGGSYVGEGLPPVPQKLADRIRRREFVDMAEMLPEFWPIAKAEENEEKKPRIRRPKQVTDFHTWLQCFAIYCSILGSQEPSWIPELMAYLITITRVSQDFTGLAWVRYDSSFRRQAAITGNRKWSQINPSLYSLCFTGRAQEAKRCELCLSTDHATQRCPLQIEANPELPARVKAVEAAVLSLASRSPQGPGGRPSRTSMDICRLWNANNCRFQRCKYRHACSLCGDPHPAVTCPQAASRIEGKTEARPHLNTRQTRREANNPY